MSDTSERLKEINKSIFIYSLISFLATTMIALGLYALFGSNGEPFAQLLTNETFVYSMLALGVAIELWTVSKLFPLWSEKGALLKEQ